MLRSRAPDRAHSLCDPHGRPVLLVDRLHGQRRQSVADLIAAARPLPRSPDEFVWAVRSRADRRAAERDLFAGLAKPIDGPVARAINRPISKLVTRATLPLDLRPNHMTAVALLIGLAAPCLHILGARSGAVWPIWLGAACFCLSSVLDGCDGELARLKLLASHSGEWFDTVSDDLVNTLYLASLGVHLGLTRGNADYLLLAACGFAASWIVIGLLYRTLLREGRASHLDIDWGFEPRPGDRPSPLQRVFGTLMVLMKRDVYALFIPVLVVAGFQAPVFWSVTLAQIALLLLTLRDQFDIATGRRLAGTVNRTKAE